MEKQVSLDRLTSRHKGKVASIKGSGDVFRRLLEMGVTKGEMIEVVKVAPLGDPIDVKVRGYNLCLRKEEAAKIVVEVIE
ncbi:MAG: ferrous iron transport protein A [archaeon]|nr:ferrous iron transport protein A [archaeon]